MKLKEVALGECSDWLELNVPLLGSGLGVNNNFLAARGMIEGGW